MYGNVVYHKVDISNQWGKDGPFNNKQLWENWIAIRKKKKSWICSLHRKSE